MFMGTNGSKRVLTPFQYVSIRSICGLVGEISGPTSHDRYRVIGSNAEKTKSRRAGTHPACATYAW